MRCKLFLLFVFFPALCFGYIDPGSGSMMLQMFVAGLFGFFFTIKLYFHKIKQYILNFFRKESGSPEIDNPDC